MKRKLHLKILTFFSLWSLNISVQGQLLINQEWELGNGNPGTYSYVSSKLDNMGNLVYISNNKTGSNSDIFLNCIHPTGNVAWQLTPPSSPTMDDYGSGVTIDAVGNLFVCAAKSNGSNMDYFIAKYSSSGSLIWQQTYNGPGNNDDAPTGIELDASNNVYVTGSSYGSGTSSDYATLKLNGSTGAIVWTKRYNFNNKPDLATDIAIDHAGNILVCGASADNLLNSDFLILKYSPSGTLLYTRRHATVGNGYDLPTEMVIDASNNVFVVGSSNNGNAKDIKLLALNSSLTVNWVQYINHNNREDQGLGITLDPSNQVIITGFGSKIGGGTDIITAKYNPTSGTQTWNIAMTAPVITDIAKGKKVKTDVAGNIYVAAEADINGTRDMVTFSYATDGVLRWQKIFNNPNNGNDNAEQLIVSGNKVYVTGTNTVGATSKTTTVKYSTLELSSTVDSITPGAPPNLHNQVIIKFNPAVVKTSTVNNKDILFGTASDFLQDSTINKLSAVLGYDISTDARTNVVKIYKRLTTTDTISIGRLGDTVRVPKFWSTLLLTLPSSVNVDSVLLDTISNIYPDIYYANYNSIYKLFTNDVEYYDQECLHPTATYPNGHINVEPAWGYEQGSNQVRIGVYDSGIYYGHPDFGGTLGLGVVQDGYDYIANLPFSSGGVAQDDVGHGTACAGLIGAVRNNNLGIAGVAGGNDSAGIPGVRLYAMRIYDNVHGFISETDQVNAWEEGASSFGYALHGMSLSYGAPAGSNYQLHEAMRYVYDNDVYFVAARGNDSTSTTQIVTPACEKDAFVINVGGSGTNGRLKSGAYNSDPVIPQDVNNLSLFGKGVDVIAPATTALVKSVKNSSTNNYVWFNGTSAATPIVAGVAGLMQSHYNNGLSPEDIEYCIERFAADKSQPGYDDSTGWGLLNAGAIFDSIHHPQFDILHFNYSTQPLTSITGSVSGLYEWFYFDDQNFGYEDDAQYWGYWYRVDVTINHTLSAGASIIDAWARNSDSKGWYAGTHFGFTANGYDNEVILDEITPTYAKMHTYFYYFESMYVGGIWYPVYSWAPYDPFNVSNRQFAYSVYVTNPTIGVEEEENEMVLTVYPNPADEYVNILFNFDKDKQVGFKLFDMAGRVLLSTNETVYSAGENIYRMDISTLSTGIYILQMNSGNTHIQKKIIVN